MVLHIPLCLADARLPKERKESEIRHSLPTYIYGNGEDQMQEQNALLI